MEKKYWIMIAAWLVLNIGSSSISIAQNIDSPEDHIDYKGNTFTFQKDCLKEYLSITDPITNQRITKVRSLPKPITLNGEKIYDLKDVTQTPQPAIMHVPIQDYVLNSFVNDSSIKSFPDGVARVRLFALVVDEHGKVVYYFYDAAQYFGADHLPSSIGGYPDRKIDQLFADAPPMNPATLNGKKVPVILNLSFANYRLDIKNHTVTYRLDYGESDD
jgi:hypothetical protein